MNKTIVAMCVAQFFYEDDSKHYEYLIEIAERIYAEFEKQDKEPYASTFTFEYLKGWDN